MKPIKKMIAGLSGLLAFCAISAAGAETMYVQAQKTAILQEPKAGSPAVLEVGRGTAVTVGKKSGAWHEVTVQGKTGWISRLFLSPNKPVGAAELADNANISVEKTSRRRSSSFAATASTRGLQADERVRKGREMYNADTQSVQKMEQYSVPAPKIEKFKKEGNLQ